ncbi:hypothetical protein AVEN_189164-1 [Araneus ventricosus]|uniref:Tc1-like transposase DDE domain-containing protein n=1 Tax=Araneus ventricosus TaxID=182803 RepID=A0A4Y2UZH8_ARAVE|nr:hypothetical protein AVEN_189164-1 [Araneus ventricosus]
MQDGATPHFSISVREALNERFPNSWIRRDGPIPWPARSPDLTPVDFFFWGYIRNIVCSENITDISDLKRRIIAAIETVTPQSLRNTWREKIKSSYYWHTSSKSSAPRWSGDKILTSNSRPTSTKGWACMPVFMKWFVQSEGIVVQKLGEGCRRPPHLTTIHNFDMHPKTTPTPFQKVH